MLHWLALISQSMCLLFQSVRQPIPAQGRAMSSLKTPHNSSRRKSSVSQRTASTLYREAPSGGLFPHGSRLIIAKSSQKAKPKVQ